MKTRNDIEAFLPKKGENFDVIVVGGGPAGLAAAIACSKQGIKTLILESRGFFGGVGTVMHWMPLNRLLLNGGGRGGVHDFFVDTVKSYGSDASLPGKVAKGIGADGDNLDIHPDYLRLAAFECLEKVNCKYRVHSQVVGAVMEGNRVTGVRVLTKDGIDTFTAKVFVDASGDGDLAYHAGVEMVKGRESDGLFMGVTLGFVLANADTEKFFPWADSHRDEFLKSIFNLANGEYSVANFYSWDRTTVPGFVSFNNGGLLGIGLVDATNPDHLTLAERFGIQIALDFVKIVRRLAIPGLENCYLARVGADLGIRETRRIVGEHVMTAEDAIAGIEFPDVIARRYGAIDHAGIKGDKDYSKTPMKSGHAFPYRSLLPKRVESLVVAGRCSSATHIGQACGKSMGNMMDLGQAAGVAAALSVREGKEPRQLDVKHIQDTLVKMGAKLFNV